jgi:HPt (histidine-containing phosphotransfer) domain-containing protein
MRARAELNDELRRALEMRWVQIRPRVVERVHVLSRLIHHGDLSEVTPRAEAITLAHKLSGGLGTFGHHEASALAAELETCLVATDRRRAAPSTSEDPDLAALRRLVARLVAIVGSP